MRGIRRRPPCAVVQVSSVVQRRSLSVPDCGHATRPRHATRDLPARRPDRPGRHARNVSSGRARQRARSASQRPTDRAFMPNRKHIGAERRTAAARQGQLERRDRDGCVLERRRPIPTDDEVGDSDDDRLVQKGDQQAFEPLAGVPSTPSVPGASHEAAPASRKRRLIRQAATKSIERCAGTFAGTCLMQKSSSQLKTRAAWWGMSSSTAAMCSQSMS